MGWFWRKRNKKRTLERGAKLLEDLIEFGHGISNPIKFFSADEILKATNNFSYSNLVFPSLPFDWYSGKNENHPMILIKKDVGLRVDLLCRDIAVSSMVSGHKNFLKLVGCCLELEKPVLVYDGVKKHYRLKISEQTWKRRMKIAEDIATAFAYLHTAFPRPFVYRSLSHMNILLDEDGVAKLIDFSLCVSIPQGETFVRVDRAEGFYSWLLDDSGISLDRVVSEKTDVFAFGMFMGIRLLLGYRRIGEKEESEGGGSDTGYASKNENHPMILIKKCARFWSLRTDLLCRDIAVSSMVSGHKNFLKLVGSCLELENQVLVYHGVKKHYRLDIDEQTWKRRMKIAEDMATAFAYLHTAFPRPFVYRNIHPWHILLDEDGVAKLIDFSLCVSIPQGETFVQVDREDILYSYLYDGYMMSSDVYMMSSDVVSEKTDVFTFGMFMGLRLLLGYQRISKYYEKFLPSKLKEDGRIQEIADPKMIEKMGQISEQELCQMEAFRMLSLRCIGPSEEVPTMVEVAKELKKIQRSLNM